MCFPLLVLLMFSWNRQNGSFSRVLIVFVPLKLLKSRLLRSLVLELLILEDGGCEGKASNRVKYLGRSPTIVMVKQWIYCSVPFKLQHQLQLQLGIKVG